MPRLVITRTPVRISFFGGGTDFPTYYEKYGGVTLSAAINKYVDVVVRDRFFDEIVISTSEKEKHATLDEVRHEIIREAMRLVSSDWRAIEIATMADVPGRGTGLGSSASVTVGALHALSLYKGKLFTSCKELAEKAYQIEADILHHTTGMQDHYIAAYGGLRRIDYHVTSTVEVSKMLDPHDLEEHLTMLYLNIPDSGYNSTAPIVRNIDEVSPLLDQLTSIALTGCAALTIQDWELFGKLINKSWQIKKQTHQISQYVDTFCSKAKSLGAWGAKLCGAGRGGFLLVCAPKEKIPAINEQMGLRAMPFRFSFEGSKRLI